MSARKRRRAARQRDGFTGHSRLGAGGPSPKFQGLASFCAPSRRTARLCPQSGPPVPELLSAILASGQPVRDATSSRCRSCSRETFPRSIVSTNHGGISGAFLFLLLILLASFFAPLIPFFLEHIRLLLAEIGEIGPTNRLESLQIQAKLSTKIHPSNPRHAPFTALRLASQQSTTL